jgi:hypothetical protein
VITVILALRNVTRCDRNVILIALRSTLCP